MSEISEDQRPICLEDLLEIGNIARLFKQSEDAVDIVMKLLSETHVDLTEPKPDGASILHSFAMFGCYEVVKLLWEKGARPTIFQADGTTVLHSAVRTQDDSQDEERARILRFFLESGECFTNSMPLDYQNTQGWTAIKLAARKNLEKCVEILIDHDADPDIPDQEDYTALHNAVGNPDILKMLSTKSKRIDAQNSDGETPLYLAAERGLVESALMLLEYGANPNTPNKEGIVPLFLAARGGHLELAKGLIKNKAAVNFQGAQQNIAPLHWAAHKEREDIALLLIKHGADILLKDKEGRTPLSMAAPNLAAKMTKAACCANPSLCLPSLSSSSPCMSAHEKAMAACCSGNVQALQALHQSGVCVNYQCKQSSSSLLHMAAYCGQLSVVMYLMSQGADWRRTDKDGDTVLHFACMKSIPQGQHEKTLEYLLTTPLSQLKDARNANGDTPIMAATRCGFVSRVKILLQFKVKVDLPNNKKELPIHRACTSDKNMEALLYLVELFPDIDVQDADGWSPLMYAAKSGSSAIVKYLVQRGANPDIRQSTGFSALYLAAQEDNARICQVLLEAGADPNLSGGSQLLSPLHIAAHRGNKKVCMLVVRFGGGIHQVDMDGDTPLDLAETAELKQAMLLAHSVSKSQRSVSCSQPRQTELTNEITLNHDNNAASVCNGGNEAEEGEERSEVTNESCSTVRVEQQSLPDNDSGAGERGNDGMEERGGDSMEEWRNEGMKEQGDESMAEYKNMTERNNDSFTNQHTRREDFGIKGRGNGRMEDRENIKTKDPENDCTLEQLYQLQRQVQCYQRRLGELEEEVKILRIDKELLISRNRSLTAELHKREVVTSCKKLANTSLSDPSAPSWLLADTSEYEITSLQLNDSQRRFFDIYTGTYRNIPVIVKQIRCVEGWGEDLYALFKEEVMKLSQLQCPYLVQFLGARIDPCKQVCILVCEKMSRGCLYLLLHVDKTDMEWGQRLRIVRDICSGMAFIHSHQILHRNLLPRNILVGEHFNAKISDFGFFELKKKCNFYSKLRAQCTAPQVYMAPEAMERDEFTAAADVYSFGMVMWEVATGEAPFAADLKQLSPVLLVMRLLMGQRPAFHPHHDPAYQQIAQSCWHGDPNLRPTFSTVLSELQELS